MAKPVSAVFFRSHAARRTTWVLHTYPCGMQEMAPLIGWRVIPHVVRLALIGCKIEFLNG